MIGPDFADTCGERNHHKAASERQRVQDGFDPHSLRRQTQKKLKLLCEETKLKWPQITKCAKQQVGRKSALTIKIFCRVVTDIIRTLGSSLGNVNAADYMQDKLKKKQIEALWLVHQTVTGIKTIRLFKTRTAAHHPTWSLHEEKPSSLQFFLFLSAQSL